MADPKQPERKLLRKKDEEQDTQKRSPLRWLIGWVVVPGLAIGGIFGTGLHLGANNPDAWYTEVVLWVAGLFGP